MIPKILHLCWLSGEEFPDSIKKCIDSWNSLLPDYEIWLWDTNRFDINSTIWTAQAFGAKKYAFAADYIRLYALYNYGGIYLDSDVIVYKSFNDLLDLPYFIGEDIVHCFEAAVIGCEPRIKWIKDVLDRYEGLEFINSDKSYNMKSLPVVFKERLSTKYSFEFLSKKENYIYEEGLIKVFSKDYFNSRDYIGIIKTDRSYCSHNFMGSWLNKQKTSRWKSFVPRYLVNYTYEMMYKFIWYNSIRNNQIPFINNNSDFYHISYKNY